LGLLLYLMLLNLWQPHVLLHLESVLAELPLFLLELFIFV
jgi:hypothetical protein